MPKSDTTHAANTTSTAEVALYRKYRPKSFKGVVGQDHVTTVLQGAVKLGNISHAYLFAGSRGTGKTSVARIFADAIGTSANDLYEIDAASNRGIDDIRQLKEAVGTLPFESTHKVYIIDEVHMLTKEAFNALLKTLEEPPKHAVFILATTEMEKLPETVVSRCQVFQFKKPTLSTLKDVVLAIAKKEGFEIEPASAELIALLGDGSFRDTEGILQKVLSSSGDKKISAQEVEMVTGAPRSSLVNEFIEALDAENVSAALMAVDKAAKANVDMRAFLKLTLHKVRLILLLRFAREMETGIQEEVSDTDFIFLKKLAAHAESKIGSRTIVELLHAAEGLGYTYLPSLPLEMAVLKLGKKE